MPIDVFLEINPPVGLGLRWWAIVAALVVVGLLVMLLGVLQWRSLGRRNDVSPDLSLQMLRSQANARISTVAASFGSGTLDAQGACQELSRATRWFAGTASDGDADYETAEQLVSAARRDPRLIPVARFVADIRDDCFSPSATPDVEARAASAKDVITQWH